MNDEQFKWLLNVLISIDRRLESAVSLLAKIEAERLPAIEASVDAGASAVESAVIRN